MKVVPPMICVEDYASEMKLDAHIKSLLRWYDMTNIKMLTVKYGNMITL